jgi:hypothetical protein
MPRSRRAPAGWRREGAPRTRLGAERQNMAAHAGTVLNVAVSPEKAGMISCAKRPRLSREPPQLIITYKNHAAFVPRRQCSWAIYLMRGRKQKVVDVDSATGCCGSDTKAILVKHVSFSVSSPRLPAFGITEIAMLKADGGQRPKPPCCCVWRRSI